MDNPFQSLIEGLYRLAAVEYDPSELIYFRIVDGNIALAQGLVNEAIAVYTEVIQNAALQPSGVFETDEEEQQAYDERGDPDKSSGHDHAVDAAGYFLSNRWPIARRSAVQSAMAMY